MYIRYKNPDNDKWENWCFEDIPKEAQETYLKSKNRKFVESVAVLMAETLKRICTQFDITTKRD